MKRFAAFVLAFAILATPAVVLADSDIMGQGSVSLDELATDAGNDSSE